MRHLELVSCIVAGLFVRPEQYAELNRRLEHALGEGKRGTGGVAAPRRSRNRPT
ncbi:MAG: hypothetical protein ACYDD1_03060 [Caulobacteraceae bacterium]